MDKASIRHRGRQVYVEKPSGADDRMMKSRRNTMVVAAGLLVLLGLGLATEWFGARDGIPWRATLAEARAESARTGKPVLVYFSSKSCAPCARMKRTWADETVEARLRDYVPVQVDVDRFPDLAVEYGVSSLPLVEVLDRDGHPVRMVSGLIKARAFLDWLAGSSPKGASTTPSR
jgi:thioredoxin 1